MVVVKTATSPHASPSHTCNPPSPSPPQVKENVCKAGFVVDKEDSSLTRSNAYMLELFARAGMRVLYNIKQKHFPRELFEVRMYVLRPGGGAGARDDGTTVEG